MDLLAGSASFKFMACDGMDVVFVLSLRPCASRAYLNQFTLHHSCSILHHPLLSAMCVFVEIVESTSD